MQALVWGTCDAGNGFESKPPPTKKRKVQHRKNQGAAAQGATCQLFPRGSSSTVMTTSVIGANSSTFPESVQL